MKGRSLIWIILALVILGGGAFAYYQYTRPLKPLSEKEADLTIGAAALLDAFESDETSANAEYLGKIVEVSGQVMEVQQAPDSSLVIYLQAGDGLGVINCGVTPTDKTPALQGLKNGDAIVLRGMCDGYMTGMSQVNLSRCIQVAGMQ